MIAIIAKEKNLRIGRRPKATMYIEDLAEFARVLLAATEMTFAIGRLRIELLLFYQLTAITGSRTEALLELRYRDLQLLPSRGPEGEHSRLFIHLTPNLLRHFSVRS